MADKFQRVISADSHINEPYDLYWNALGDRFGEQTPRVIQEYKGQSGKFWFGGRNVIKLHDVEKDVESRYRLDVGYVPQIRQRFQEEAVIEAEVLNPGSIGGILGNPENSGELKRACFEVYHDWMAEFISFDPNRFIGVAVIPIYDDVGKAVADLEKYGKKGLRTALIRFQPPEGRPPLRDPIYDPFWAAAQDLGVVISLHIGGGGTPDPLHAHTPREQEEGPGRMIAIDYEIMGVLANEFIFGAILDRFPRLKLVCSEFEISWIPSFMSRLDQIQQDYAHRMPIPKLEMQASDYMRQRIYHGFIDDPYALPILPLMGSDAVVWGSDFPHIRSVALNTQEHLANLLNGIPRDDQEKIVGANAARLWDH